MVKVALYCACAITLLTMTDRALAWGNDGHRITGYIATALLNETARQRVRDILGNDDLAAISTLMDDDREAFERRHPGASRWHYENRPVCGDSKSTCPHGECVTAEIERYSRVLHDSRSNDQQRETLAILVHLIGDLHQPLHLADNHDRGGNDVFVLLPREREPRRLHEAWDTRFVHLNLQRHSLPSYARFLLHNFSAELPRWQSGDVESWAHDTYMIGKRYGYEALPNFACTSRFAPDDVVRVSTSYENDARRVVAEQLAKAGVHIAVVLNRELAAR